MRRICYLLFGLALFASCCKEVVEKEVSLSFLPEELSFDAAGGSMKFSVVCNTDWSFGNPRDWFTTDVTSGTGNTEVTVTAQPNNSLDGRSATLKIKAGDQSVRLLVTQKGMDLVLESSEKDLVFDAAGGEKKFTVSCNSIWEIVNGSKGWFTTDTLSGTGDREVTVTVEPHGSKEDRSANLTLKSGDKVTVVNVTQKGKNAVALVKKSYIVEQYGDTLSIDAESNIEYTVTVPTEYAEWIKEVPTTRAVSVRKHRFAISENREKQIRSGYIVFSGNSLSDTARIYQSQFNEQLLVNKDTFNLSVKGGMVSVEVKSNIEYDVTIPPAASSWLTRPSTRALRVEQLDFVVAENTEHEAREAKVVIKDRNSTLSDTLTIRQAGLGLLASGVRYTVRSEGDVIRVEAKNGVNCDKQVPAEFTSWIGCELSGTGNAYDISVGKYEGMGPREGYVVFSSEGQWDTVHIRQFGQEGFKSDVKTETIEGITFKMIYVQGVTFTMGATSEQGNDANDKEKPAHKVMLSDYYIGEFEVTQELWEKVMGTTVEQQRDKMDKGKPLNGKGADYPMYYVSWNEAVAFCTKLSEMTGKKYVLPTEAQWEFAARGGVKSAGYKYSGNNEVGKVAWHSGNSDRVLHPVGQKEPNELGIYDMSGSVGEWCQDGYGSYSNLSQTNPKGSANASYRVLRGGDYSGSERNCRVSYRGSLHPENRSNSYGFRVVLLP